MGSCKTGSGTCEYQKVEVDYQVQVYSGFINYGNESPAFEEKLVDNVNVLRGITEELTNVQKAIYQNDKNTIYFKTNSIVIENGTINTIIVLVLSFAVGIVAAGIVNLIIGCSNNKEMAKAKEESSVNNTENKE